MLLVPGDQPDPQGLFPCLWSIRSRCGQADRLILAAAPYVAGIFISSDNRLAFLIECPSRSLLK